MDKTINAFKRSLPDLEIVSSGVQCRKGYIDIRVCHLGRVYCLMETGPSLIKSEDLDDLQDALNLYRCSAGAGA